MLQAVHLWGYFDLFKTESYHHCFLFQKGKQVGGRDRRVTEYKEKKNIEV